MCLNVCVCDCMCVCVFAFMCLVSVSVVGVCVCRCSVLGKRAGEQAADFVPQQTHMRPDDDRHSTSDICKYRRSVLIYIMLALHHHAATQPGHINIYAYIDHMGPLPATTAADDHRGNCSGALGTTTPCFRLPGES